MVSRGVVIVDVVVLAVVDVEVVVSTRSLMLSTSDGPTVDVNCSAGVVTVVLDVVVVVVVVELVVVDSETKNQMNAKNHIWAPF